MKSINLFFFLIICSVIATLVYFDQTNKVNLRQKISLEVLDLFPQGQDREMIDIYRKIGDSNMILVAQDEKISNSTFEAFLAQVRSLSNVKEIITSVSPNEALENFIKQNYFYLGYFTPSNLSSKEIEQKILQDFALDTLNPLDPLGLVQIPNIQSPLQINGYPLAIVKFKSSDAQEIDELYHSFAPLAQSFGITHYFSPSFINVINPQLVMEEVNLLGGIALIFFVFLYFAILRMPFLTLNSILTILFSNLVAILALLFIYPKVSIMSLSFGIGISNICIDYMMHHHFLGFYLQRKIRFNSSVFYGFATTIIGFFVCLFVPFPLLNQLSLYAIINLSVAYLCFAFLYQKIGFSTPKYYSFISKIHAPLIPSWIFLLLAFGFGGYSLFHLQKDLDLSKLDYQNKEFDVQKEFFSPLYSKQVFLLQAPTINSLITRAKEISKISEQSVGILALLPTQKDIKKREQYFKSLAFSRQKKKLSDAVYRIKRNNPELAQILSGAYRSFPRTFSQITHADLEYLGVEIFKDKSDFYFQGSMEDAQKISHFYGIYTQQPKALMQDITNGIYAPMISILALAFVAITILLFVISGKRILDSLGFIVFPLACVLTYLWIAQIPINIMHLFAMLLIVVVGVDYGIYHIKEKDDTKAKHAVLFSTLTTLLSFGLFLFSNTKALSSFGEVIGIGMLCILIMIFFQRDQK